MITAKLFWNDYNYFPYERELARREVEEVFGVTPSQFDLGLSVTAKRLSSTAFKRLTYFKYIEVGGKLVALDQARLEASANGNGQAWDPEVEPIPTSRRQSTRYSAHGLHEYKGKFNPQIVRAIGNIIGLGRESWVLDPFCGSGTTLLEGAHMGWNCVGLDLNPLGVLIANTKIKAFRTHPASLEGATNKLIDHLKGIAKTASQRPSWKTKLPNNDYLARWFTRRVLNKLGIILRTIDEVVASEMRDIFRIGLSDICRDVSLQDPGDLRIRRRKSPPKDFPVIPLFVDSIRRKVEILTRAQRCLTVKPSQQIAVVADCRNHCKIVKKILASNRRRTFDAAITSPPYATALPYIDTQRLSLCLLGLIDSKEIRPIEKSLIGNREIGSSERKRLEEQLVKNVVKMPDSVNKFCKRLVRLADAPDHGFRRRNVPALVFKYLAEMADMFKAVLRTVKAGGRYALVVGSNKTELQGEVISINTPYLLADIAEFYGWGVDDIVPLNTYHRFDVHQENSIENEVLLILHS